MLDVFISAKKENHDCKQDRAAVHNEPDAPKQQRVHLICNMGHDLEKKVGGFSFVRNLYAYYLMPKHPYICLLRLTWRIWMLM